MWETQHRADGRLGPYFSACRLLRELRRRDHRRSASARPGFDFFGTALVIRVDDLHAAMGRVLECAPSNEIVGPTGLAQRRQIPMR